jgi:hypothetical protein
MSVAIWACTRGVLTNFTASDLLGVQGELTYSTKGFKIDDTRSTNNGNTSTQTEITSQVNYLDLPLLVQVRASHLFFEAGPQFSFLLDQKTETRRTVKRRSHQRSYYPQYQHRGL